MFWCLCSVFIFEATKIRYDHHVSILIYVIQALQEIDNNNTLWCLGFLLLLLTSGLWYLSTNHRGIASGRNTFAAASLSACHINIYQQCVTTLSMHSDPRSRSDATQCSKHIFAWFKTSSTHSDPCLRSSRCNNSTVHETLQSIKHTRCSKHSWMCRSQVPPQQIPGNSTCVDRAVVGAHWFPWRIHVQTCPTSVHVLQVLQVLYVL